MIMYKGKYYIFASMTLGVWVSDDMAVSIRKDDALGHLILWGSSSDKLYHSCIVYGEEGVTKPKRIGALVASRQYVVRVDGFNENGITEGDIKTIK